tara:strand:+ start:253 stop:465 length:213 start_codon:yes stop_codon:yes gene_type:complete
VVPVDLVDLVDLVVAQVVALVALVALEVQVHQDRSVDRWDRVVLVVLPHRTHLVLRVLDKNLLEYNLYWR